MNNNGLKVINVTALLVLFLITASARVGATTVSLDDFEDGDLAGWLGTTTGGSGSTGVELKNSSQMGYVQHTGNGSHSVSMDFSYMASDRLSFDMIVVSNFASNFGVAIHSTGGVKVSFLNAFNSTLGTARIVNTSNPGALGANAVRVDTSQHYYSSLLSDYLSLAGLDETALISKVSLSYFTSASTNQYGSRSHSKVWFDNVEVSAVPVPAAVYLFISGLMGLVAVRRRKI